MRLGSVSEVTEHLGISRQALAKLRAASRFPAPIAELAAGPIWDLDDVSNWTASGGRRGPGRPPSSQAFPTMGGRISLDEVPIGKGGFASVYRGFDYRSGETVAVKLVDSDGPEDTARFRRELRMMVGLQHPHVVRIVDQGQHGERLWYAMPLALGNLAEQIVRISASSYDIINVMLQICAGLEYIHKEGIFHRDLKPANILEVEPGVWAIADFGLGREQERQTTALTHTGDILGTYVYAAPEQLVGAKYAGPKADIYSLGKILQELVTGDLPVSPNAPIGNFRHVIARAINEDPEKRHSSVAEFRRDIEQVAAYLSPAWKSTDEVLGNLRIRTHLESPDTTAVRELTTLELTFDESQPQASLRVAQFLTSMPRGTLTMLWEVDPEWLRSTFQRFAEYIAIGSFEFGFCDPIANYCLSVIRTTRDPECIGAAIWSLLEFGARHDRWYVRGIIAKILQEARTRDEALTALTALERASSRAVDWGLNDFAVRSLHPVLRHGVERIIDGFSPKDLASDETDNWDDLDDVPF